MGYKIVVASIDTLLVTARAVQELARIFLRDGTTESLAARMVSFAEIKELLGVEEYLSLRENLSRR